MSMELTISCDALNCCNEIVLGQQELEGDVDAEVSKRGWFIDYDNENATYCSACAPAVKRELESG